MNPNRFRAVRRGWECKYVMLGGFNVLPPTMLDTTPSLLGTNPSMLGTMLNDFSEEIL